MKQLTLLFLFVFQELVTKLNSVQKLEKFSATYTNSVQGRGLDCSVLLSSTLFGVIFPELSVVQGLGHKFGAPKRKLTARLREEFARSMEQHSEIEKLLQSLLHMAKKVLDQKQVCQPKPQNCCASLLDHRIVFQGGLQASSDENSGKVKKVPSFQSKLCVLLCSQCAAVC